MAHDVFVSYSSKDKPIADGVCAALESNGLRCWIAPRDVTPGKDWGEAIIDAIQASKAMVLVFSAHANDSQQVKREVQAAFDKGLTVVPFRVQDVMPAKALAYYLSPVHWLDAMPVADENLQRLVNIVRPCVSALPGAPTLPYQPQPMLAKRRSWRNALLLILLGIGGAALFAFFHGFATRNRGPIVTTAKSGLHTLSLGPSTQAVASQSDIAMADLMSDLVQLNADRLLVEKLPTREPSEDDAEAVSLLKAFADTGFRSFNNVKTTTRDSARGGNVDDRLEALGSLGAKPDDVRAFADELFTVTTAETDLKSQYNNRMRYANTIKTVAKLGFGSDADRAEREFIDHDFATSVDWIIVTSSAAHLDALRLLKEMKANLPSDVAARLAALSDLPPQQIPSDQEITDLQAKVDGGYSSVQSKMAAFALQRDAMWNQTLDRWSANLAQPLKVRDQTFDSLFAIVKPYYDGHAFNAPAPSQSSAAVAEQIAIMRHERATDIALVDGCIYANLFGTSDPRANDYARCSLRLTLQAWRLGFASGQYVDTVVAGTAKDAGVKVGDVLVTYNGVEIGDADSLADARKETPDAEPVKIEFLRADDKGIFHRLSATLAHGGALGLSLIQI